MCEGPFSLFSQWVSCFSIILKVSEVPAPENPDAPVDLSLLWACSAPALGLLSAALGLLWAALGPFVRKAAPRRLYRRTHAHTHTHTLNGRAVGAPGSEHTCDDRAVGAPGRRKAHRRLYARSEPALLRDLLWDKKSTLVVRPRRVAVLLSLPAKPWRLAVLLSLRSPS